MEEARQERELEELQNTLNKIRNEILSAPSKEEAYTRLMQHIAWLTSPAWGERGEIIIQILQDEIGRKFT